jgi:FixJ family two-component response regulator
MPGGGGDHSSRRAIVATRERERQVVQLVIRGLAWREIARQLGMGDESTARKAFNRAIKRIPAKDVDLLRKLQSERETRPSGLPFFEPAS